MKQDVYEKITSRIVADLEQGVMPWLKPWNAEHAAGRITRPLRANGQPYQGINVLMLWGEAVVKGYAAPIWVTFRQAQELGANVRKGEQGSLVVYADRIRRTEIDDSTGEEAERERSTACRSRQTDTGWHDQDLKGTNLRRGIERLSDFGSRLSESDLTSIAP